MLRLCPQCRIPITEQGCPRCGFQPGGKQTPSETSGRSSTGPQPPIQFDVVVSSESTETPKELDWRAELKKRLEERAEKPPKDVEPEPIVEQELERDENQPEELPTKLFRYKLDQALRTPAPQAPTASAKPTPPVFEKPLVRQKPVRPLTPDLGQRSLRLRPAGPVVERMEPKNESGRAEVEEPRMSREVLFSRFLSGIVDLFFPVILGATFTVVASLVLSFDLLYAGSIKWIALFAFAFFLFNSLFFLLTSGQTLGMMATDLHLVTETDDEELTATAVLLRVLFFVPSVFLVIGLVWAIFDPWCRGFHDLVSRTRVVPGR